MSHIVILPAPRCRRSKKIMDFLDKENIAYKRIELLSPQGQEIANKYHFLASPGILLDEQSVNPFTLMQPNVCKVDREKFLEMLIPKISKDNK